MNAETTVRSAFLRLGSVVALTAALASPLGAAAAPEAHAQDAPIAPVPDADLLGAVGIGVSDLARSTAFYIDVLGMQQRTTFHVGDLDEVVVGYPGARSADVVLMHWQNDATRHYDGTNVKLVFVVGDPAAILARLREHGGKVERDAAPIEVLNGRVVGLGRDPDNYLLELMQR